MRRIEVVLVVFGISVLAYLYGVASTRKGWFPTTVVEQGWIAAKALEEVWEGEAGLPPRAIELVDAEPMRLRPSDGAPPRAPTPSDDLLLISGGPFKLMDFCPELGCLAWLMDRNGTVYHAWPIDPALEWGENLSGYAGVESLFPAGGHVYDNGDIVMVFHGHNTFPFGAGIARFDRNGRLLWKNEINAHHWFDIDDAGLIHTPAHRLLDSPVQLGDTGQELTCEDGKIYEDLIVTLDPDGKIVDEMSLLDVYIASGYAGLLELARKDCDPLHLNDVRVLKAEDADAYPDFAVGDILVSTHAINTIAVIDRATRRIKWLTSGTMIAQHSPRFAGHNRILAFDNRGGARIDGQGGSRIVSIDVASERTETIFPPLDSPPSLNFFSDVAGVIDLHRSSTRALVSLYDQGRVLEIDLATGDLLWEYDNVHDISAYRSDDDEAAPSYARFDINSAYYVPWPAFLQRPVARAEPAGHARAD